MKITLSLSTGKQLTLSAEEYEELRGFLKETEEVGYSSCLPRPGVDYEPSEELKKLLDKYY